MELSERLIKKFEDEGYASVYELDDGAGTTYDEQVCADVYTIYVTDGSVTIDIAGEKHEVRQGQQLTVSAGKRFSMQAGANGLMAVVGEKV